MTKKAIINPNASPLLVEYDGSIAANKARVQEVLTIVAESEASAKEASEFLELAKKDKENALAQRGIPANERVLEEAKTKLDATKTEIAELEHGIQRFTNGNKLRAMTNSPRLFEVVKEEVISEFNGLAVADGLSLSELTITYKVNMADGSIVESLVVNAFGNDFPTKEAPKSSKGGGGGGGATIAWESLVDGKLYHPDDVRNWVYLVEQKAPPREGTTGKKAFSRDLAEELKAGNVTLKTNFIMRDDLRGLVRRGIGVDKPS